MNNWRMNLIASVDNVSDDDTYTLYDFENDRVFGWELIVSEAYASNTTNQVLHIPPRTAKCVLRDKKSILIKTQHNLDGTKCTIKAYTRKIGKKEMYLTEGWYEFKKANRLREGDKLEFQLSNHPPEVVIVDIVRRNS
ncbi:hypothetical protein A2U01_0005737 [Trifolium medium]|uniref:TF-B3 domain-containing protein n=1 Tax=Trifolium medium TaxID=97028 RepID=A0A392MBK6_9FABA|nr:hypothetical protein [Trifolium medium]